MSLIKMMLVMVSVAAISKTFGLLRFFFSSRRRHTRFDCAWSSDVCSSDLKDISTEYSALRSKVVKNPTGTVKFPINEPATGRRKSQIQEYLDYFKGAGVQHLAISTDDLVATVSRLQGRGIEVLNTPESYYDGLAKRVGR